MQLWEQRLLALDSVRTKPITGGGETSVGYIKNFLFLFFSNFTFRRGISLPKSFHK